MLFQLGKKYRGYWSSKFHPVSISYNEKIWKVVSVSDNQGDYFFSLFQKSDGSAFFISGEDLAGETLESETIEDIIFAKVFNSDNDVSVKDRFIAQIGAESFNFVSYRFTNKKYGPQLANYGYNMLEDTLVIIGLSWSAELELSDSSFWPIKYEALISGVNFEYKPIRGI